MLCWRQDISYRCMVVLLAHNSRLTSLILSLGVWKYPTRFLGRTSFWKTVNTNQQSANQVLPQTNWLCLHRISYIWLSTGEGHTSSVLHIVWSSHCKQGRFLNILHSEKTSKQERPERCEFASLPRKVIMWWDYAPAVNLRLNYIIKILSLWVVDICTICIPYT